MRFVLKTEGTVYEKQLNALVAFFCEARYAKDGIVLGIQEKDGLMAVALIDEAIQKPWPEMENELGHLKQEIGEEAFARLELYEKMSSRAEPKDPHYLIGMIGVRPEHHRKGYARAILERVKDLSTRDRRSIGVCLNTENPDNVPFYERFGYRTIAEVQIQDLHSWCMFLPTLPHTP